MVRETLPRPQVKLFPSHCEGAALFRCCGCGRVNRRNQSPGAPILMALCEEDRRRLGPCRGINAYHRPRLVKQADQDVWSLSQSQAVHEQRHHGAATASQEGCQPVIAADKQAWRTRLEEEERHNEAPVSDERPSATILRPASVNEPVNRERDRANEVQVRNRWEEWASSLTSHGCGNMILFFPRRTAPHRLGRFFIPSFPAGWSLLSVVPSRAYEYLQCAA